MLSPRSEKRTRYRRAPTRSRRSSWPSLLAVRAVRLRRRTAHALKILHRETELSEHFLVGNRLVALQPFVRLGDSSFLFFADLFVLDRRVCDRPRHRVE